MSKFLLVLIFLLNPLTLNAKDFDKVHYRKGDVILVKMPSLVGSIIGRRLDSYWSHALIYMGENKTLELTRKGIRRMTFSKRYMHLKHIILDIPMSLDDRDQVIVKANVLSQLAKFDHTRAIFPYKEQKGNKYLCHEFIEEVLRLALNKNIDVIETGNQMLGQIVNQEEH